MKSCCPKHTEDGSKLIELIERLQEMLSTTDEIVPCEASHPWEDGWSCSAEEPCSTCELRKKVRDDLTDLIDLYDQELQQLRE